MRHTQSRFPFPLVRPYFTAESLRGWWDGVVGREGQQQHRATTPTATPPLFRTLCGLRSHLEPSVAVAEAVRRTGNRRPTTGQTTTGDNETDNSSRGSGRATGSAAAEAERRPTDGQTQQKATAAEQERQGKKANNPAQQTTVQDDWTAALRGGPRPTPPSACLTHAVRIGIGRSPNGTPAISSLGPPEVRVGSRTAPQTILRGEREAQVAIRKGRPVAQGSQVNSGLRDTRHINAPSTRLSQQPSATAERGRGRRLGRDVTEGSPRRAANRA